MRSTHLHIFIMLLSLCSSGLAIDSPIEQVPVNDAEMPHTAGRKRCRAHMSPSTGVIESDDDEFVAINDVGAHKKRCLSGDVTNDHAVPTYDYGETLGGMGSPVPHVSIFSPRQPNETQPRPGVQGDFCLTASLMNPGEAEHKESRARTLAALASATGHHRAPRIDEQLASQGLWSEARACHDPGLSLYREGESNPFDLSTLDDPSLFLPLSREEFDLLYGDV